MRVGVGGERGCTGGGGLEGLLGLREQKAKRRARRRARERRGTTDGGARKSEWADKGQG